MPHAVADALFDTLKAAFPAQRDYGPTALSRAPMPPAVAHYLQEDLRHRLNEELQRLRAARTDAFDYDHPEVHQAHQAFAEVLARHARIPRFAWLTTLRRAVDQVVAYLLRPARTLVDHVFPEDCDTLPAADVFDRLRAFAAYPYFHDVMVAYFEQRAVQTIDRARFAEVVHRIDRQMTDDYGPAAWLRLLGPLFDTAAAAPAYADGLPAPLLRDFFADKDALHLARRLDDQAGLLDREALRQVLTAGAAPALPPADAAPAAPVTAPPRTPAAVPPAAPDASAVPLWQQFRRDAPPHREAPREVPREAPPAPQRVEKPAVPLWQQFRAGSDEAGTSGPNPSAELAVLERAVLGERGPRNRALFVKHLFGGSEPRYLETLRHLREAPSWHQASQIIAQDVFLRHQVNIYSDPAVAFTDAVQQQFEQLS